MRAHGANGVPVARNAKQVRKFPSSRLLSKRWAQAKRVMLRTVRRRSNPATHTCAQETVREAGLNGEYAARLVILVSNPRPSASQKRRSVQARIARPHTIRKDHEYAIQRLAARIAKVPGVIGKRAAKLVAQECNLKVSQLLKASMEQVQPVSLPMARKWNNLAIPTYAQLTVKAAGVIGLHVIRSVVQDNRQELSLSPRTRWALVMLVKQPTKKSKHRNAIRIYVVRTA